MIMKENGFNWRMLEVSPKKNKLAEVYYYFLKRVLKKCHIIETLLTYHKVLTIK